MRSRAPWLVFALVVAALGAVYWFERAPRVVGEGEALPLDRPVEMRFQNKDGEVETWKLEKKQTTREESLGKVVLPTPDPAAADHVPDESARALDGAALEDWKHGNLTDALAGFDRAIAADPDDRVPRSHAGRLLSLMTDYAQALPHLERAAQLAPEDPQVWLDLASLYERSQRLDASFEARARAEALAGGRQIDRDEQGFFRLEGSPSFP
jgi:tetratricopeptide (TPR) repeat protein